MNGLIGNEQCKDTNCNIKIRNDSKNRLNNQIPFYNSMNGPKNEYVSKIDEVKINIDRAMKSDILEISDNKKSYNSNVFTYNYAIKLSKLNQI